MSNLNDAARKLAQDWVWGHADHECGGLHPGTCSACDDDAARLAERVRALATPERKALELLHRAVSVKHDESDAEIREGANGRQRLNISFTRANLRAIGLSLRAARAVLEKEV
jgi:hypothetical protein